MKFKVVGEEFLVVPDVNKGVFEYEVRHGRLLDDFKWKPGANVQAIWRKHGWQPPSEYRNDYLFKHNREVI